MKILIEVAAAALAIGPVGFASPNPARVDQARANYEALLGGQKQLGQLSPQELADVVAFAEALRDKRNRVPPSQRCVDAELSRLGGTASDLAMKAIDLKCRELGAGLK